MARQIGFAKINDKLINFKTSMNRAEFRFHAELNDFLPRESKNATLTHQFPNHPSIKDSLESFGIPHPEVAAIAVNGKSVDFSYRVQDGDRCDIYPISQAVELSPRVRLRPQPEPRFVLDIHLGKLAGFLRMLGFDTLYRNDYPDEELARVSSTENRILLTRDIGLLKRGMVTHGYWVRSLNPHKRLEEVLRRFELFDAITPFSRCIHCNGLLETVTKNSILERLEPKTREHYDDFRRCNSWDKIYWKGSHYEKMQEFIEGVRGDILLK